MTRHALSRFRALLAGAVVWLSGTLLSTPSASALQFLPLTDAGGRQVLLVFGRIDMGDDSRLRTAIAANPGIREFWLASPGGFVSPSFELGRVLRETKRPVRVPGPALLNESLENAPAGSLRDDARQGLKTYRGVCASACGMLLAGGLLRFVNQPYTVGLHSATEMNDEAHRNATKQRIAGGDAESDKAALNEIERRNQETGFEWTRFMQEMGVSGDYVKTASRVPSGCMLYLSASEMDDLNVVNVKGQKTEGPAGPGRMVPPTPECR